MPRQSSVDIHADVGDSPHSSPPRPSRQSRASSDKENDTPKVAERNNMRHAGLKEKGKMMEKEKTRRRAVEPEPVRESAFYYDPEQSITDRRAIRQSLRSMQRLLDERKQQFSVADGKGLLRIYQEAQTVFKNIRQTDDAMIDAQFNVSAVDLLLKQATNIKIGSAGTTLDLDEFVGRCVTFMKNGGRPQPDEEEDVEYDGANWAYLGRQTGLKSSKRPVPCDFLMGSLRTEKKPRVIKQRRRGLKRKPGTQATQPVDVDAKDIQASETNTLKLVQKVFAVIKKHLEEHDNEDDGKINLFELVLNPESFGQSVENIFFVSFLAREGKVAVYEDAETHIPVLEVAEPATQEQKSSGEAIRNQMIFSLTMLDWKRAIEVFGIEKSIIPTRPKEHVNIGTTGWYT